MTIEELKEHAKKYSQSYAYDVKNGTRTSIWSTNFDAMAKKTTLKLLLSKYGIMNVDSNSTDMARALAADQSVIRKDGTYHYIDNDRKSDIDSIAFVDETIGIDSPMMESDFETETEFEEVSNNINSDETKTNTESESV